MSIVEQDVRLVNASHIVGIDRTSVEKLVVILGDGIQTQAAAIFPGAILTGYAKFQRAVLHASGIYFSDRRFEGQAGRRRWRKVVNKLLRGGK